MLEVEGIETSYGRSQVLFGMSLKVSSGEVVTLMGRNGMGKTTTIRSIMGMTRPQGGSIRFEGAEIAGLPSFRIAKLGLGLVPEGRQIFPNLSVRENLVATAENRSPGPARWTLESVLEAFPRLAERAGNMGDQLSGGEQQMLAIARALMTNPKLLLLDEATEGLAPLIRAEIWTILGNLKAEGQAILVVDKNIAALTGLADRHTIIEKGRVAWTGTSAELSADAGVVQRYLGV
jgi:branched-chain amino acid transport system ATP-binding protein